MFLLLGLAACTAEATSIGDVKPSKETGPADSAPSGDLAPPKDRGAVADLPAAAGEPCFGSCAGDLLCLAGRCHHTCTPTDDPCNDKTPPCGDEERCLKISDFAHACLAATTAGGACGEEGVYCAGGTMCVEISPSLKRCLTLCKYGCAGQCVKTVTNCDVCVP